MTNTSLEWSEAGRLDCVADDWVLENEFVKFFVLQNKY